MALPFTAESRGDKIPDGTIRKTWDMYEHGGFGGTNLGAKNKVNTAGVQNTAGFIDGAMDSPFPSGTFFKKDGFPYSGWGFCDCNGINPKCDTSCPVRGRLSSYKLPIGAWARTYRDLNTCNERPGEYAMWGAGKFGAKPEQLPDDISTHCSGGANLGYNQTLPNTPEGNSCVYGGNMSTGDDERCFISGIQYPVFCQLGDYIETQSECRNQCQDVTSTDSVIDRNYCNYAYDRLCSKQVGDPLKNDDDGNPILSDKNYITESTCQGYCGGPGTSPVDMSSTCRQSKIDYCSKPGQDWGISTDRLDYCKDFWGSPGNFNSNQINTACGAELIDPTGNQNIFTINGCSNICAGGGGDIDTTYCDGKRLEYCQGTKADGSPALFSPECFSFCVGDPDRCEASLRNVCKTKIKEVVPNIDTVGYEPSEEDLEKIKTLLKTTVDSQGRPLERYCGCLLPEAVYTAYIDSVAEQFENAGYSMEQLQSGQLSGAPECIFPNCRDGLKTASQAANTTNGTCGTCVQNILLDLTDAEVGRCVIASNSARCQTTDGTVEPIQGQANDTTKQLCAEVEATEEKKTTVTILVSVLVLAVAAFIAFIAWRHYKGVGVKPILTSTRATFDNYVW